jgi:hypothetical protein
MDRLVFANPYLDDLSTGKKDFAEHPVESADSSCLHMEAWITDLLTILRSRFPQEDNFAYRMGVAMLENPSYFLYKSERSYLKKSY